MYVCSCNVCAHVCLHVHVHVSAFVNVIVSRAAAAYWLIFSVLFVNLF